MTDRSADVVVIGGGIIGCSIALEVARLGRRVVVLERERVGYGASSRNGGIIAIFGREPEHLPLIVESLRAWTVLALRPDVDIDYVRAGILWVAFQPSELEVLERFAQRERLAGVTSSRLLTLDQTRALLPSLGPGVIGGALGPLDGHCDSPRACAAVARLAVEAGAELHEGVAVEEIERRGGVVEGVTTEHGRWSAPAVVLAAGAWSPLLARTLGRELPIAVRRGQAIRTVPRPRLTDLALIAPHPESGHVAIRQLRDGRVTISGYQRPEYVGYDQRPTEETLARNRQAAERALPPLAGAVEEARWAGLNEQTLDNLPQLGEDPRLPGLFLATGFSGHGFGIAPAVGRLMAELVVSGRLAPELEPFRVDRFDHLDIPAAVAEMVASGQGGMLADSSHRRLGGG